MLALLVAHFNEMTCIKLWLKSGHQRSQTICVHTLCETFATTQADLTNILPYNAITGCDAVSDIAGHEIGSAWNAFCSNPDLLANLSKGDFHDENICKLPEKFICRMFNLSDEGSCDKTRVVMIGKCRIPEALSPTYM